MMMPRSAGPFHPRTTHQSATVAHGGEHLGVEDRTVGQPLHAPWHDSADPVATSSPDHHVRTQGRHQGFVGLRQRRPSPAAHPPWPAAPRNRHSCWGECNKNGVTGSALLYE